MIHTGDCIEVMAGMPAESVDAVVTDPPYAIEFMGKAWDAPWKKGIGLGGNTAGFGEVRMADGATRQRLPNYHGSPNPTCRNCGGLQRGKPGKKSQQPCQCDAPRFDDVIGPRQHAFQAWCEAWGREALRVTKPGGYLLAFGGTRTHHRLVCGLEDAGWIIRDELDWIYACLSDDTELLTDLGWVPYNRASEATHAAAFDTATGQLRWERIAAVHKYDHEGPMVHYGPALTTLNHRVVLSPESEVPLPSHADLRGLWGELRDVGQGAGGARQDVLPRLLAEAVVHASRSEAAGGSQGTLVLVRDVREADVEAGRMGEAHQRADVLLPVQREASTGRPAIQDRDASRLDGGVATLGVREDDRRAQPSLEGRRYRVQEARELLWRSVRAGTGLGEANGPQGRVRDGAPATDGGARGLPAHADRMRQPREPRPDRQPPREPDPLAGQPDPQAVRVGQGDRGDELPLGDTPRLVDYAGVVWCITVPSGAFVARRNGIAFVTGNSGFPKGKANLKPAHEPIVLARKPGPLRPLAIDACRIPSEPITARAYADPAKGTGAGIRVGAHLDAEEMKRRQDAAYDRQEALGRWPSNLLLSDPALFDEPNPEVVGSGAVSESASGVQKYQRADTSGWKHRGGVFKPGREWEAEGYGDTGGYSRFFRIPQTSGPASEAAADPEGSTSGSPDYPRYYLIPKSSRADREPVLRGQLESGGTGLFDDDNYRQPGETRGQHTARGPRENAHPTVKPTDLMRHLVRLVTPSRNEDGEPGLVLDCFLGSGSTAIACELEGFRWIGIEQSPEYVAIAEARLNGVQRGLGLDTELRQPVRKLDPRVVAGKGPSRPEGASQSTWFTTGYKPPEEAA